ncbi:MAG: LPS biosynthesis protein [Candidatus Pacebacteria bacterium CG10_big_fil_rev_8_21_14_0_10_44_54]|nr:glycosyltransferase family 2 protein [Candidatus Paceibacterota bacterium]PIR60286.1 MAG: LPS biosynthesis protein [Candidatus Pacebacteria bacterium CG10_big_fil_rev_8_21_14_0_10_44_54]
MISVVLATHNEAKNIARCLGSVKDFADEIVVVDGTSTDETTSIAKTFGAKVLLTKNKANFHINKQQAIDEAKGDLILQLDADEVVDESLARFVVEQNNKKQASLRKSDPVAWYIRRKNDFLGKFLRKGGQYPDPVIRLFYRGTANLPQKNVHEQMEVSGNVGMAEGHLLHYPYPTLVSYLDKFNRYTSFEASRLWKQGVRPSFDNTLAAFTLRPCQTFFRLFLRHRGYVDGWRGLLFASLSAAHHPLVAVKLWEQQEVD